MKIPRMLLPIIMTFTVIVMPMFCNAEIYRVTTNSGSLNIREAPSKNASVITTLPTGTKVEVTSIENGWATLTLNDDVIGYTKSDYLKPVTDNDKGIHNDKRFVLLFNDIRSTMLKLSTIVHMSRTEFADPNIATIALVVFLISYIILFILKYKCRYESVWSYLWFVCCYLVSVCSYIVLLPTTVCWLDDTWGYFISVVLFGITLFPYWGFMKFFISAADEIGDVSISVLKSYFFYMTPIAVVIAAPCIFFQWNIYDWIIIGYIVVSIFVASWCAYKSLRSDGIVSGIVVWFSMWIMAIASFAQLLAYATHSVIAIITIAVIVCVIKFLAHGSGEEIKYPVEGYLEMASGERIEGTFISSMVFQAKYGGRYYHYSNGVWR